MSKLILSFGLFFCSLFLSAQIIVTEPSFITTDYTGAVKIIFNPAQGNGGMATATQCWAHTGLITSASSSDSDWKFATAEWRGSDTKYQMTKEGTNWVLNMTSLVDFYACPSTTQIEKLCFVFNDGPDGSLEGKTADGSDIYVDLVQAGLNVKFTSPTADVLIDENETVDFVATSSSKAQLTLTINGTSEKTLADTTSLALSKLLTVSGNYQCIITATKDAEVSADTLLVCVAGETLTASRPAGTKPGINYDAADPTKVTLITYAMNNLGEKADHIYVLGDFNQWTYSSEYQMKEDTQEGYFWITLTGLSPKTEYAFEYAVDQDDKIIKVDDAYAEKILDPWNDKYIPSSTYPNLKTYPVGAESIVSVLETGQDEYTWSDATLNFDRPDKENLVIYELWVYNFSPLQTIKSVTNRLDYLEGLGINAIELMPISEFDGNYSWGYNPNHFFAPDKSYGTKEDYKDFIDACHERGIAVIMDMVFNHATGNFPYNKLYALSENPFFNVTAPHGYSVFEDFNHDFVGTQDYFVRVLNYWLEEYHVDGYRMDLSAGFCGEDCDNRVGIIFNYYNQGVKAVDPNAYFILEHWEMDERQNFVDNGMMCWQNTNDAYSQTAMGWLKDGDDLSTASLNGYVSYAESHDEERNFYKAKMWGNSDVSTDETVRLNRVPLNVAFSVMLNGPKMLWMFEELGFDFSINSNEKGVDTEDSRTTLKPFPERLGWYKDNLRMAQYEKIAQITQLRTQILPDVFAGDPTSSDLGSGNALRSIIWGTGTKRVFVVGNFSATSSQPYTLPTGNDWYDYLEGSTTSQAAGTHLVLATGEVKVFTSSHFELPVIPSTFDFSDYVGVDQTEAKPNCVVFPTQTTSRIYVDSEETVETITAYSLYGVKVAYNRQATDLDLSNLNSGYYLIVVNTASHQYSFKVLKQ